MTHETLKKARDVEYRIISYNTTLSMLTEQENDGINARNLIHCITQLISDTDKEEDAEYFSNLIRDLRGTLKISLQERINIALKEFEAI